MGKAWKHRISRSINYNIEEKYLPIKFIGSKECGAVERRQKHSSYGHGGGIHQKGVAVGFPTSKL